MSNIKTDEIIAIVVQTVQDKLMPRFGKLSADDISEKSPGDWLTIADIETEAALTEQLTHYLPDSFVVGEESFDAHPETQELLRTDEYVWVIDPIDGTTGFKNKNTTFVTMVALRHNQETILGIIHHPVSGDTLVAERGGGTWLYRNGQKIRMKLAAHDLSAGAINIGIKDAIEGLEGFIPYDDRHYYPTGGVYGCMFIGENGEIFSDNGLRRVANSVHTHSKPWDHFAGKLMIEECGGYVTDLFGRFYNGLNRSGLIVSSSKEAWEQMMPPRSQMRGVIDRTLPQAFSLSVLTDGKIPYNNLSDLIGREGPENAKTMTENFLGFKIKDSRLQPLFDYQGKPLRVEGGKQICLPWTWPACLSWEIIRRAGRDNDLSAQNLSDLPVPFYIAVDVYLVSADGYALATTRSNVTPTGVGKSFSLAAGYGDVRDGSVLATALREMREETDLTLSALKLASDKGMIELPLVTQRLANIYKENMSPVAGEEDIRQSCCPSLGYTIALKSRLTAQEIVRHIKLNEESVGLIAVPVEGLFEQLRHPSTKIEAVFWPSSWRPGNVKAYGFSNTLARSRDALTKLRQDANSRATRPQPGKYRLGAGKKIIFSAPQDMMWKASQAALSRTVQVAERFGLVDGPAHILTGRRWRRSDLSIR